MKNNGTILNRFDNRQATCRHLNGEIVNISYTETKFGAPLNSTIRNYRCNKNCLYENCLCNDGSKQEFYYFDIYKK